VDLQHNVFANRTSFITIGKEAETVRGEMRNLRGLISEVTSAMSQISATTGGDSFMVPRSRGNRSSVANLEALWNSHLQQLWKRVDGTQKFLPAIPGRHVVHESGKWMELNSATWKPRRKVHVILLNDHFVIAGEKKRGNSDVSRDPKDKSQGAPLALIKCWPLQEVQITDLPQRTGGPGGPNQSISSTSINVRAGPETMTFTAENQDVNEKLTLLSNFRKAFEDLRKNLELETQDQIIMPNGSNSTRLASPVFNTAFFGDYAFSGSTSSGANKADMYVDVDGKPQSLRQVEGEVDDLDIKIALQTFDEAVALTERLRRVVKGMNKSGVINGQTMNGASASGAPVILARKLEERTGKLAGILLKYTADEHNWMGSTRKNVDWLTRLGYEDRARETYLDARTEVIHKRIR
jgi:exocyst complex component 8